MNRSSRRASLFIKDDDCVLFLSVLDGVPRRFGAIIHGYALMPNHYHLMIEVPRGNLSEVMRYIGLVFTQAYNRSHGFDGPLFRGRFKNRVVEDDAYWMHLLAYLHLNPVRGGLFTNPEDCLWTSHNAYAGHSSRPDWLTTDDLLGLFGSPEELDAYIDGWRRKTRNPPSNFDEERLWRRTATATAERPEPIETRTFEQALEDVASQVGVEVSKVLERPRGRSANGHAWLAAWWLVRSTGESQREISIRMGVTRPRLSQLLKNMYELAAKNPEMRDHMDALESRYNANR